MMVHPHDADKREADDERNIRGPLSQKLSRQLRSTRRRNLDLQDQQRDGDREYAIRKMPRPARFQWSRASAPSTKLYHAENHSLILGNPSKSVAKKRKTSELCSKQRRTED
jgi:hypothetical protein